MEIKSIFFSYVLFIFSIFLLIFNFITNDSHNDWIVLWSEYDQNFNKKTRSRIEQVQDVYFYGTAKNKMNYFTEKHYIEANFFNCLYVEKSQSIQIKLYSNERAELYIDEQLLIKNELSNRVQNNESALTELNPGYHLIRIYHQRLNGKFMLAARVKNLSNPKNQWTFIDHLELQGAKNQFGIISCSK